VRRPSLLRPLRSRRRRAVDTHDVDAFPGPALRTAAVRVVLAAAAIALVFAAVASARNLDTRAQGLVAKGTTGVVVVDLSLSIANEDYQIVRRALRKVIAEDSSIGLVVFSDIAYELLPPGTPASEIEPMLRLLVPPRFGSPVNPWTQAFRAGTRISTALELARGMLERDRVQKASILLVSDLETAPDDVSVLTGVLQRLRASSIALRVVALGPSSDARVVFEDFVQDGAFDALESGSDELRDESPRAASVPRRLVVLGVLLFLVLAAHELFGGRLALTGGGRGATS
jgi:von Willebrand factor type A domain